jgi:hypothetical protein
MSVSFTAVRWKRSFNPMEQIPFEVTARLKPATPGSTIEH